MSVKSFRWSLGFAFLLAGVVLVGALLLPGPRRSEAITNIAISARGNWVAAGTRDGRVKVCTLSTISECRTFSNDGSELNDLQFSPDERFLVIADDDLRLVNISGEIESSFVRNDKLGYGTVRFDSGGSELVTINSQSRVELINLKSPDAPTIICCSSFYGEVAFVNGGAQVVNAGHWPRVWTRTGKLIRVLAANRQIETLRPIVVDDAAHRVFMGSQDGRIYAWSFTDFSLIEESPAQADYIDTIALVRELDLLAYCRFDGDVHLWRPDASLENGMLSAPSSSNIAALPDNVSIAFGTNAGTVQIWSLKPSPHLTAELKYFAR